jgi:putative nucleotidyltransferase with HDIG domain
MTREEGYAWVTEELKGPNLIKHVLATEAIMRALAQSLGEDEEAFGLAGLIHDVDYELTGEKPEEHGRVGAEWMRARGVDETVIHAVLAHNGDALGVPRESVMDRCLYAADPMTGLIVAAALVRPSKKLADVTVESILKKWGSKSFAKGASRTQMETCRDFGMELTDFIDLSIRAMQAVSDDLGL